MLAQLHDFHATCGEIERLVREANLLGRRGLLIRRVFFNRNQRREFAFVTWQTELAEFFEPEEVGSFALANDRAASSGAIGPDYEQSPFLTYKE